jgi:hypothetical protein
MAADDGALWLYDGGPDLIGFNGITASPGVVISALVR